MHRSESTQGSSVLRLGAAATAGGLELIVFHPVDTIAKRLMSNRSKTPLSVFSHGGRAELARVVFAESQANAAAQATSRSMYKRYLSLFPGLGFAASYKVLQRTYKFGGQPLVSEYLNRYCGPSITKMVGERGSRTWLEAISGSLVGVGEVLLLPLDVLKIKSQTNPQALTGKGVLEIFKTHGRELYRGAGWTAARNAPGSFALFGGNHFAKSYVFQLPESVQGEGKKPTPTFFQFAVSSMLGSALSILVSQPIDVIKTRIQNRAFDDPASGMRVARDLVAKEGVSGFFKGVVPKLGIVGPKLVFSFTIAQWLIAKISN